MKVELLVVRGGGVLTREVEVLSTEVTCFI